MTNKKRDDDYVDDDFVDVADNVTDDNEWLDSDDNYVDEDMGEVEDNQPQPQKKKSKFTTIIIVAGVLLFVVVLFSLFSGSGSVEPSGAQQETAQEIDLQAQPDVAVNGEAPAQEIDITPNNAVADVQVNQPSDSNVAPETLPVPSAAEKVIAPAPVLTDNNKAPDTLITETPSVAVDKPAEAPVNMQSGFPTVDKILKPQPDVNVPAENVPVAAPITAPVEQKPMETANVEVTKDAEIKTDVAPVNNTSAAQSDAYKEAAVKLTQAEAKIAELEAKLAEINSLKSKISELETKLAEKPVVSTATQNDTTIIKDPEVKEIKEVAVVAPKPVVKPIVRKETPPVKWVLKSASSGKAIIANENGSDLKTVYVGDNVASIGRVIAIEKTSSGWVIKGTKSSIHQ